MLRAFLLIATISVVFVFAKKVPISSSFELIIPVNEYSVVEFPFKISDISSTSFRYLDKNQNSAEELEKVSFPSENSSMNDSNSTASDEEFSSSSSDKGEPIAISAGENTIQLLPTMQGKIELVVWGYDEYPLMISVVASNKNGNKLYELYSKKSNEDKAIRFESANHETVISRLVFALYNKKVPIGYKKESDGESYNYEDIKIKTELEYRLVGDRYVAEEWSLSNDSNQILKLQEEMFYQDSVYGISIENNEVEANKKTKIYLIRAKK